MTLHEKATNRLLDEEDFSLITTEMLNKQDQQGDTVWVRAAAHDSLNAIPSHLFTEDVLNFKNSTGNTTWQWFAKFKKLNDKSINLIIKEALQSSKPIVNNWRITPGQLDLVNKYLINLKNKYDLHIFAIQDVDYIENVLRIPERLDDFIKVYPARAKEIEFRDPRLKLVDVGLSLSFRFDGIFDTVILNKEGVFLHHKNYATNDYLKLKNYHTLNNVVSFIEQTYPNIEKSLVLPKKDVSIVGEFIL